jgi:(p)ppGpp synthase/HD superfamily hydrolase
MQQGGNSRSSSKASRSTCSRTRLRLHPKGDIRRLPRGATCVDFAYDVHTDVGNRCVAAKVDRRLVPLRTALRNGQTVEIITARGARRIRPGRTSSSRPRRARRSAVPKNLKRGEPSTWASGC